MEQPCSPYPWVTVLKVMITARHDHAMPGNALRVSFLMTSVILVIEIVAGLASHSLALLADAGHVVTDVIALGLAWFAVEQSKRPADIRHTYGYVRTGILVALANGMTLIAIAVAITYEATRRLAHPEGINALLVIISACVAISVNTLITIRLRGEGESLNVKAASLHVRGDLAASVGVVIAGVIVITTGWLYADPLISIAIALLVTWSACRVVLDASNILLEGVPKGLDVGQVEASIRGAAGVVSVHNLHVWSLSSESLALSCHVIMEAVTMAESERTVRAIEHALRRQFGISRTTIQIEVGNSARDDGHAAADRDYLHPPLVG